jgi:glc operon protein GlcG
MLTHTDTQLFEAVRAGADAFVARVRGGGEAATLVLVDRMGAIVSVLGTDDLIARDAATRRARTAAQFGVSTEEVAARVRGASLLGRAPVNDVGPGGVPVYLEGRLVGALGVAGADASRDERLAKGLREAAQRLVSAPLPEAPLPRAA